MALIGHISHFIIDKPVLHLLSFLRLAMPVGCFFGILLCSRCKHGSCFAVVAGR
jgi:hypothetical protein